MKSILSTLKCQSDIKQSFAPLFPISHSAIRQGNVRGLTLHQNSFTRGENENNCLDGIMIIWQHLTWVLQQHTIHHSSFCWRAHSMLERSPHYVPDLNREAELHVISVVQRWVFCFFFFRLTQVEQLNWRKSEKTMTVSLSSPTWSLAFFMLLEITSHSIFVLWFINKYSGTRGSLLHLYHLCKAVQSVPLSYKWVILTYVGLTLKSSLYLKISRC